MVGTGVSVSVEDVPVDVPVNDMGVLFPSVYDGHVVFV